MPTRRRRMTPKRTEKEEADDEKEKPGQEKECCCLQRFALRCGQFQVPSTYKFFFLFVVGAWDLKLA